MHVYKETIAYSICPRCEYYAACDEAATFCARCGARLVVACRKCGAEIGNPFDLFCPHCGKSYRSQKDTDAIRKKHI